MWKGKIKDEASQVRVKVKFSVCLIKLHALKTWRVVETPSLCIYIRLDGQLHVTAALLRTPVVCDRNAARITKSNH